MQPHELMLNGKEVSTFHVFSAENAPIKNFLKEAPSIRALKINAIV